MARQRLITQEKFDELLAWLHADREQAGIKYEEIRRSLIKILAWRGCSDAEGLADETINIVADRLPNLKADYSGAPALYFFGVANMLSKECWREAKSRVSLGDLGNPAVPASVSLPDAEDNFELEYECLQQCLQQLRPEKRELILAYYQEEKQAKIDHRKGLARRLGIKPNALRVRARRIRADLEECIELCLGKAATETD